MSCVCRKSSRHRSKSAEGDEPHKPRPRRRPTGFDVLPGGVPGVLSLYRVITSASLSRASMLYVLELTSQTRLRVSILCRCCADIIRFDERDQLIAHILTVSLICKVLG